jgi:hypothetical protein
MREYFQWLLVLLFVFPVAAGIMLALRVITDQRKPTWLRVGTPVAVVLALPLLFLAPQWVDRPQPQQVTVHCPPVGT